MDSTHRRATVDPWQESLERSLARRGKSRQEGTGSDARLRRTRKSAAKRLRTRILTAKTIPAFALVMAILAGALTGGGPDASPSAARADAQRVAAAAGSAKPRARNATQAAWRKCPLAIAPTDYVNPLQSAIVNPERVDQGVDYAGVGKLVAIGSGRITRLATDGSGWPGTFIQYQLLSGADSGCYVYYAEGVVPADGLRVGDTVSPGEPIATIIPNYPTGIELGWGGATGTKTYAKVAGQWSASDDQDNVASAPGRSFSALIAALGGPPGKLEG
ncbi:MAG: hypothetical protein JO325_15350 [Solirubrobacterales bacterium]|nr:hypothetical protein [Solirubrobacterales bacterium]